MTPALRQFLTDYLAWAEADAPDDRFNRWHGLCVNAERESRDLLCELNALFCGEVHPFGGIHMYWAESEGRTIHRNPDRLAWIRAKLAQEVAA